MSKDWRRIIEELVRRLARDCGYEVSRIVSLYAELETSEETKKLVEEGDYINTIKACLARFVQGELGLDADKEPFEFTIDDVYFEGWYSAISNGSLVIAASGWMEESEENCGVFLVAAEVEYM